MPSVLATHTPGPWTATLIDDEYGIHEILMGDAVRTRRKGHWEPQRQIEWEHGCDNPDQAAEADANARLIAAAPDLLEACRLALPELESERSPTASLLRAVIAKAEGR